jgi:hypothetical protein
VGTLGEGLLGRELGGDCRRGTVGGDCGRDCVNKCLKWPLYNCVCYSTVCTVGGKRDLCLRSWQRWGGRERPRGIYYIYKEKKVDGLAEIGTSNRFAMIFLLRCAKQERKQAFLPFTTARRNTTTSTTQHTGAPSQRPRFTPLPPLPRSP